jgi:hypothetical protein
MHSIFVVEVAPFFVKEARAIRDQELHVPGLWSVDCGEIDFVKNSV